MKYIYILLTIILFNTNEYSPLNTNIEFEEQVTPCPEGDDRSIFYVTGVLLESLQNTDKRDKLGLNHTGLNQTEIESRMSLGVQTSQALREYWDEKGVEAVSDQGVCQQITKVLQSNEHTKSFSDMEYRKIYYKIGNKYLILYAFKQTEFSERNVPSPLLMDEQFNIIGELDLRMKRR